MKKLVHFRVKIRISGGGKRNEQIQKIIQFLTDMIALNLKVIQTI